MLVWIVSKGKKRGNEAGRRFLEAGASHEAGAEVREDRKDIVANTNAIEKRKNEPKGIVIEMGSTTDQRIEDVIVDDKLLFYSFCIETSLMGIQVRYKIFYFIVVQIIFLGGVDGGIRQLHVYGIQHSFIIELSILLLKDLFLLNKIVIAAEIL